MTNKIKVQKLKDVKSKIDTSRGERSPYWDDFDHKRGFGPEGPGDASDREHVLANPDILPETTIAAPSTPQLLMGEAIEHMQGRQKEVYLLLMREGKTFEETAEILNVTKGSVQKYKERAIKFITAYCEQAIKKGRV